MDPLAAGEDDFLVSARAALRGPAQQVLTSLGWGELLPYLDDPDARQAVFALFRAQGQELVTTTALGTLQALPYTTAGLVAPKVTATIERGSLRRGLRTVVVGKPADGPLLIDRPGTGAWVVDVSPTDYRAVDLPGHLDLHEIDLDLTQTPVSIPEEIAAGHRARSAFLGRTALAYDILGASEAALRLAVDYAKDREQFGQPIGRFQAIRHLLAMARTDCAAIHAVADQVVQLDSRLPPHYDEILKALAGRNGRRTCQRSLQVLGGISFTAEHPHHHYYSRVLTLDSLLGNTTTLTQKLAANWRATQIPHHALTTAMITDAS